LQILDTVDLRVFLVLPVFVGGLALRIEKQKKHIACYGAFSFICLACVLCIGIL
jgi:hypothetical protein